MTLLVKGWRGNKMQSDPVLFLFLHTVLGSACVSLWAMRFLTDLGSGAAGAAAALNVVFALHIWPERSGVPNRLAGGCTNELGILVVLVGSALTLAGVAAEDAGLRNAGMDTAGAAAIAAPVLEVFGLLGSLAYWKKTGEFPNEGEEPIYNLEGYYKMREGMGWECPWKKGRSASMSPSRRGKAGGFEEEEERRVV